MLKPKTRWELQTQDEALVKELSETLNLTPVLSRLMINRGLTTPDQAREFINIEKKGLYDPFLLDGMDEAVNRIQRAVDANEKILVFGDYDADGVSATSLMVRGLRKIGANVRYYVPNRFTEGYGPNVPALERAKEDGISLVITVDTGISANDVVDAANMMDLDVIITDHHEPPPELPKAKIIINPKKPGCPYPFKGLAGVGVAFKLIHALINEVPEDLFDLVAIGTIADLVPLIDENRLLAIKGLKRINTRPCPGIKALLSIAEIDSSNVTEDNIGFGIGPRINAAGRMDHARPAIELMLTDNDSDALQLAAVLDEYNVERKQIVEEMANQAIAMVEKLPNTEQNVIVVAGEDWHEGVIGIVASRIVEAYYKPAIVLAIDPETGMAKGSARSIEGFDIFKALSTSKDILPHFGGHEMAAGMSLLTVDIGELRERLNAYAKTVITPEMLKPLTKIDQVFPIEYVSTEQIETLYTLAPFGVGNPKPKFILEELSIASAREIGANKNHLKLLVQKNDIKLDGIGFGMGSTISHIEPEARVSIVGELSINEWNGVRKPQVMMNDIKVDHWQLFDWRGHTDFEQKIVHIPKHMREIVCFNESTLDKLTLASLREEVKVTNGHQSLNEDTPYLFLLDLPDSIETIQRLIQTRHTFPERIYLAFYPTDQEFYFSTFPNREQFKWVYAFVAKKKKFRYSETVNAISKHKAWRKELVEFMFQVFFELDFAKIEEDYVTYNSNPDKKPLNTSQVYVKRQEMANVEELLNYSSRSELKEWFNQFKEHLKYPEEVTI